MWGHPTSRKLDQQHLLQLTRMYFVDDTEPYAESKALAMARKYIRKHYGHGCTEHEIERKIDRLKERIEGIRKPHQEESGIE